MGHCLRCEGHTRVLVWICVWYAMLGGVCHLFWCLVAMVLRSCASLGSHTPTAVMALPVYPVHLPYHMLCCIFSVLEVCCVVAVVVLGLLVRGVCVMGLAVTVAYGGCFIGFRAMESGPAFLLSVKCVLTWKPVKCMPPCVLLCMELLTLQCGSVLPCPENRSLCSVYGPSQTLPVYCQSCLVCRCKAHVACLPIV